MVGFHPDPGAGTLAHQSHAGVGDLAAGRHSGRAPERLPASQLPASVSTALGRPLTGGYLDSGPAHPAAGADAARVGSWWVSRRARWRWCSPACRPGMWCCRCGCLRARASGRTWAISWPTPACGTRSTWCGSATAKPPAAGATTRICWSTSAGYESPSTRPARRDSRRPARRSGCQRVQPGGGLVPRRPSRAAGRRADRLHRRQQHAADAGSHTGPGSPARLGSLPAQHQRRPVRALGAATQRAQRRVADGLAASRSPTRAGRGRPAPMGCRYGPTATTRSRQLSAHPHRSRRRCARCQSSQTRPRPRGRRPDRGHPRQHDHRRGLFDLHLGAPVGQEDRPVQPRHAGGRPAAECEATGGRLYRAGTRSTAMCQHCLCGGRVPKTLAQRTHDCPHCGLHGDRDIVSAMLAACVQLADPDDPRTARVDYRLAHALRAGLASQQEWEGSVNRHQPPTPHSAGSARTGSHHPVASAEQAALGPPPNRPGSRPGRRGTSRKQPAPKLIGAA